MALVVTGTVWVLFACFLLFPLAGLPAALHRVAMALLVAELLAAGLWTYGSAGCRARPCAPLAEAGRTAATVDVPVLAGVLVLVALAVGVGSARR